MRTSWTPPYRWVFGVATVLGLFSTLQAYRLTELNFYEPKLAQLLVLNLSLWYIPAALTPIRTIPKPSTRASVSLAMNDASASATLAP